MKLNSTLTLTLVLLLLMVGAGGLTGWWAYILGDLALQGVSQPDVSPSKKLTQQPDEPSSSDSTNTTTAQTDTPQTFNFLLDEDTLIQQAQEVINGTNQVPEAPEKPAADEVSNPDDAESSAETQLIRNPSFSTIEGESQGVTLQVSNAFQQDGALVLTVNLKNESSAAVQFLYSFLEVRDERGRSLTAITDDLPGEVPSNGDWFTGTVRIADVVLADAQTLSLALTNYPDQDLQLNLTGIPVTSESAVE
jgi:hypothetical protein